MYEIQLEVRLFEKRAYDLFLQSLVKGTSHLSLGQEAIAAGFGAAMRHDDYTFCTYRGHAHTLARGVPTDADPGRAVGARERADGRQGRVDAPDQRRARRDGLATRSSAPTCAIANGAAWSAQYRGTGQVAVCFFGDGTTNIGAFHEALNLAKVWKLPVVFVCENNLYMEYTSIGQVTCRSTIRQPTAHPPTASSRSSSTATTPTRSTSRPVQRSTGSCRSWAVADRSADLPPRRPQPRRSRQVPARGGGRRPGSSATRYRCTTSACCNSASAKSSSRRSQQEVAAAVQTATDEATNGAPARPRPPSTPTSGPTEARTWRN